MPFLYAQRGASERAQLDTAPRVMATKPKPKPEIETQVVALRRKDFAIRWSICLRTLDDLVTAGIVPTIKLGKRCVRIPVEPADAALMAYMANGKEGAA